MTFDKDSSGSDVYPAATRRPTALTRGLSRSLTRLVALPPGALPLLAMLVSIAVQALRTPDLFTHPQFFAEDGPFYGDAWASNTWALLFSQKNGYLQALPRLVAGLAQWLPLRWAPTLFLIVGACVDAMPAAFLVSRRMEPAIPQLACRLLLAALYIANPVFADSSSVLTYSQWRLGLVPLLILLSRPARRWYAVAADFGVTALAGLSGPYCLLLAPVAAIHSALRYSRRAVALTLVLGMTALAQVGTLLLGGLHERSTAPHGASLLLLFRILGGRIFMAAFGTQYHFVYGQSALIDCLYAGLGVVGTAVVAVAFLRGTHALRMLILFAAAIVGGVLITASVPSDGPAQWPVLTIPRSLATYFVIPCFTAYAVAVWMLSSKSLWLRRLAATALSGTILISVPLGFHGPSVTNFDFPASVRRYEAAAPDTLVSIPIPPYPPWRAVIVKR